MCMCTCRARWGDIHLFVTSTDLDNAKKVNFSSKIIDQNKEGIDKLSISLNSTQTQLNLNLGWGQPYYQLIQPASQGGEFTGNQVPMKCISSSEFFGRIHALLHFAKINPGMWAHNKWFLVTRMDILWQELIFCDKNWFLVTRMDFLS